MLVRKLRGWSHAEACSEIDRIIGNRQPSSTAPTILRESANRAAAIHRVLAEARSPDVVERYLQRRGLTVEAPELRGSARCAYFDDTAQLVGYFPAVIAPIISPGDALESVQRIYDAEITPRKKILPAIRSIRGGAVRLFDPINELAVTEGVETALAVYEMYRIPSWAALSANGLQAFAPPSGLLKLHIFADNDANAVGQAAAYALAKRVIQTGMNVDVLVPPETDTDWLDVLNKKRLP